MSRKHHVVSQGYQRLFADGRRIQLVDKRTGTSRAVGTRDAFAHAGFNSRWIDGTENEELEYEWARIENIALPLVRSFAGGAALTPDRLNAVKVVMAMHVARSYRMRRTHDTHLAETAANPLGGMDVDQLRRSYIADKGHPPAPGALEELVREVLAERFADGQFFVDRMVHMHNQVLEKLGPWHLQVVRCAPGGVEFITGDTPVVIAAHGGRSVNVAIGDADSMFFPTGRYSAVAVSTEPLNDVLGSWGLVQVLNRNMWRASERYVGCHPSADWRRCLAFS